MTADHVCFKIMSPIECPSQRQLSLAIDLCNNTMNTDIHTLDGRPKTASELGFLLSSFRFAIYKTTQLYLRHPLKLFKPVKYDTLYFLRIIDNHQSAVDSRRFSSNRLLNNIIQNNSLCVIYRTIKMSGLKTVYDKILPPLVANTVSGTILFSTYLTLDKFQLYSSFSNGVLAGLLNNAVNTPLENFYNNKILNNEKEIIEIHKKNKSLLRYIYKNINKESLMNHSPSAKFLFPYVYLKEGLSYGVYFYVFEKFRKDNGNMWNVLKSGVLATISLQMINHPMKRLDAFSRHHSITGLKQFFITLRNVSVIKNQSYFNILYKNFVNDCFYKLPSMTGTLILLDYLRSITD